MQRRTSDCRGHARARRREASRHACALRTVIKPMMEGGVLPRQLRHHKRREPARGRWLHPKDSDSTGSPNSITC